MELKRNHATALLLVILTLFVLNCGRIASHRLPDGSHDEALYFSGAKSLAETGAYTIPNLPGEPAQTKYPVLFSLLLAAAWLIEPEFPANVFWAHSLVIAAGALFLWSAYRFTRSLGATRIAALAITAICSLHLTTITLSTSLLSDIPFAAVMLTSMVVAEAALRKSPATSSKLLLMGCTLICVVVMMLLRTLGIAAVVGIAAYAVYRRSPRFGASLLCAGALTEAGWLAWVSMQAEAWSSTSPLSDEFIGAMTYYTSYARFWLLSVPDWGTLIAMLKTNLLWVIREPGVMCLQLPLEVNIPLMSALGVCVSGFVFVGAFRDMARAPKSVHVVFPLYALIIVAWNFPIMWRMLFPFLPYFLWGLGRQSRSFLAILSDSWRGDKQLAHRLLVVVYTMIFAVVGLSAGYAYLWSTPKFLQDERAARIALQAEKTEAYEWINRHTNPSDRFVATGDGTLYLHTGRKAIVPAAPITAWFYRDDPEMLEHFHKLHIP